MQPPPSIDPSRCPFPCGWRTRWVGFLALCVVTASAVFGAEPREVRVDFSQAAGRLRPLHGVNKGPLGPGGLIDLTAELQVLRPPSLRLHDCHWPNPDVVDIHVVFPNPEADPERPESYDFAATDEYLLAAQRTGAQLVYRLGESIEHNVRKRFVHPPPDPVRWARICAGIVRHYNEGWAGGFRLGIRDWEIWNEPENRPAMWSGTDEQYLELYAVTARELKSRFPGLRVGGPGVGGTGRRTGERFEVSSFIVRFLEFCRQERLPLDFFSWHAYGDDPQDLVIRARGIRRVLDDHGFAATASCLNEWNYLPGNSWDALSRTSSARARQRFYEEMSGVPGAAFIAAALLELQDAPIEMANLFHGELGAFGLFNEHGVPQRNYEAVQAVDQFLGTGERVQCTGGVPGRLVVAAGVNAARDAAGVMVVRTGLDTGAGPVRVVLASLPWDRPTRVIQRAVTPELTLAEARTNALSPDGRLTLPLPGPGVILLQLQPGEALKP